MRARDRDRRAHPPQWQDRDYDSTMRPTESATAEPSVANGVADPAPPPAVPVALMVNGQTHRLELDPRNIRCLTPL